MNLTDIAYNRLVTQQIVGSQLHSAKDVVDWMGALQAQDMYMSKWAVGVRFSQSTEESVQQAIDNGEIIRTHVLRPTWHFVSPGDIYWMLELTAPQIKNLMRSRDRELGLTEDIFKKSQAILEKVLCGNTHLTRAELVAEFKQAGIAVDDNRVSHILMHAEIDGIICSGKSSSSKITYALLYERVIKTKLLTRDEALAELAVKYFTSHCPATLSDFSWWSGLTVTDSRKALEMVKSKFISEKIENQEYWFTNSFSVHKPEKDMIHVLPAFDEFIIGYKSRAAVLTAEQHSKVISKNGIFRPVIVQNGLVIGIWKRTLNKGKVILEPEFFNQPDNDTLNRVKKSFLLYAGFINKIWENPQLQPL